MTWLKSLSDTPAIEKARSPASRVAALIERLSIWVTITCSVASPKPRT